MTVKQLTEQNLEFLSLKGGCSGSSESTLLKKQHCWKSHVTANVFCVYTVFLSGCRVSVAANGFQKFAISLLKMKFLPNFNTSLKK